VSKRTPVEIRIEALDEAGGSLHANQLSLEIFPSIRGNGELPTLIGEKDGCAQHLVRCLFGESLSMPSEEVFLCDDPAALANALEQTLKKVEAGAQLVLLNWPIGAHTLAPSVSFTIEKCAMGERNFVSIRTGHRLVEGFKPRDFSNWYGSTLERITPLLATCVTGEGGCDIITAPQAHWDRVKVEPSAAVREFHLGKGTLIVCQLRLADALKNPVALEFVNRLFA
jgi:hypothetical protein